MSTRHGHGLLLSIRPHFADAIIEGRKTIELRRTRPNISPGTCVLLYASAPRMAVVASARVTSILEDEPANIWRDHQNEVGISAAGFEDYFWGADTAYALRLQNVAAVGPLPLSELRALGTSLRRVGATLTRSWSIRSVQDSPADSALADARETHRSARPGERRR